MGMFSLVDAVLDKPMEDVLNDVHLADDIRAVLINSPDTPPDLQAILDLAVAYEKADWESMEQRAATAAVPTPR